MTEANEAVDEGEELFELEVLYLNGQVQRILSPFDGNTTSDLMVQNGHVHVTMDLPPFTPGGAPIRPEGNLIAQSVSWIGERTPDRPRMPPGMVAARPPGNGGIIT